MGKKIDSIIEMHNLGLPAPKCIFIMEKDNVDEKLREYFETQRDQEFYTLRTDRKDNSMSLHRLLTATREETIKLTHEWHQGGDQIILQEFINEKNEIKSGNIWIQDTFMIIEGALDKHMNFTNGRSVNGRGRSLDVNIIVPRFDSFDFLIHRFFTDQKCLSLSEILRLIRLARRIPYTNAMVEFSFFKNGSLYFWEIKKEKQTTRMVSI